MRIIIFITAGKKKEAQGIAKALVKNKLAACVNIIPRVESFFWWKGEVDRAQEFLLVVKSKKARLPGIIKLVKSLHSYDIPETIAFRIVDGEKSYLRWLDAAIR